MDIEHGSKEKQRKQRGGWISTPFIFGSGVCDWLASFGIRLNLITYLTTQMNMPLVQAATTVTNFGGMSSIAPLLGAFIADSYLGRYKTILIASIFYTMAISLLVIDAATPSLRPHKCNGQQHCQEPSKQQIGFLYLIFVCIALASGGVGPNAGAFGADQFDQRDEKERKHLRSFFNWFYFFLITSILLTTTVLVYVQDHVSWTWGFGIPMVAMALSALTFWMGSNFYRRVPPQGSPLSRLAQVIVAAIKNRHLPTPKDANTLYGANDTSKKEIQLCHTDQFRFLDKAAIIVHDNGTSANEKINSWRLCTVHQIEELKALLRMMPIWATGVVVFVGWSQQNTFWIQQARTMNRHIGKFEIPAGSTPVIASLTLLIWVPIYDRVLVPVARRITGNERGVTFLQRIGTGAFLAGIAMLVAGFVEVKRRNYSSNSLYWTWIIPQFLILGLSEAFIAIGYLEFFYDQAPPSMRSIATAVASAIFGASSYLSTLLVTLAQTFTSRKGKPGWLATNINHGRLEYFYWMLSAILCVNFFVFLVIASYYKYTKLDYERPQDDENVKGDDGDGDGDGAQKILRLSPVRL